ncbi:MAG: membrane-bound serine protease (ClpP class) [Myxococcota bacterium]
MVGPMVGSVRVGTRVALTTGQPVHSVTGLPCSAFAAPPSWHYARGVFSFGGYAPGICRGVIVLTMRRFFLVVLCLGWLGHAMAQPRDAEAPERRSADAEAETTFAGTVDDKAAGPDCTAREIPFTGGQGQKVIRLDIHDTIDLGLAPFVSRVLEQAHEDGAALVLIHMNTPGGRLDAAQTIKDALLKSKVPTAVLIDTHALSAGALIAYATDYIFVTEGATMGAATPINIGQGGEAQAVGEKFVSAVRAIFRSTAEAKGRDGRIAEAMVDKDVVIFDVIQEGKLLTMPRKKLLKYCVADFQAEDVPGVLARLNLKGAEVEQRSLNWAERVARVLTDPMVSSMLMSFGFLGLMLEMYTAGFGIAGMIGATCLFLFFFGHMVVNLVGLEELMLFVVGFALLGAEIFVIPGFGLAGAAGITALVAAVALSLVGKDLSFAWDVGLLPDALARVGAAMLGTIVIFAIAARYLTRSPWIARLVLKTAVEGGSYSATDGTVLAAAEPDISGQTGVTTTPVRGSGKARIGGRVLDVVNEGPAIDKGTTVVVVSARPGRIVVGVHT